MSRATGKRDDTGGAGNTIEAREDTTWDGLPVSKEPPFGAAVVVYRRRGELLEFLVLHRGHEGADYEGDWAWGTPSGARFPGEDIQRCATRELAEETSLSLLIEPLSCDGNWYIYRAEAPADAEITLSEEHDRYIWLPLDEAAKIISPEHVRQQIFDTAALIGHR